MRDQYDDEMWQAHKGSFEADMINLFRSVAFAFKRLTARTYDAPWRRRTVR